MAFRFSVRLCAPAIAGFSVAALAMGLAPAAQATPTIATVTARLAALAKKNEVLTEQFNRAGLELRITQRDAVAAARTAQQSLARYEKARTQVLLSIADQYRGDGDLGRASALFTSKSGQNYLDRMSALQLVAARRTTVTAQLQLSKTAAAAAGSRATAMAAAAVANRDALAAQRKSVQGRQTSYQTLLDQLTAAQKLALQRARAAAAAANSKANARTSNTNSANGGSATSGTSAGNTSAGGTSNGGTTSGGGGSSSHVAAPSNAAAVAVSFAMAQLGKPYVFAAAGPDSYDCSGLTMAAWGAAGVSLPHFAEWQYNVGQHVSISQLAPGDLVFFYSPISHVAMYIGNGMIVHAPTTGDVVRVVPLSTFSSDYVGATRP